MNFLIRFGALFACSLVTALALPAAADYEGPDGYGATTTHEHEVSHDGYPREGETSEASDPTTYVVIEADEGDTEQVDGETVIVIQEPEPIAATEHAPPPPQTVTVEQAVVQCPGAIWVDGYWYYSNGQYLWVDGHCVVERVNYIFVQPRWDYYANIWWFVPGYYCPWGVYVGFGYYRPWHWYPPYYRPYHRAYRPVPVHRSVPRRPTSVRTAPAARVPSRGVLTRPGYPSAGRTTTVERKPPGTYGRTGTVGRVGATPTRSSTVTRGRPTPERSTVVYRPPASTTRTPTVGRPTLTSTVPRSPSGSGVVSQPRVNPTRTGNVYRPPSRSTSTGSVTRPAVSPSRTGSVGRPRTSGSRSGGIGGRSSSSPSRSNTARSPSSGSSRGSGFGGGGFSRPSGGFGGSRSAPAPRGR
jgi:hypothetical protein